MAHTLCLPACLPAQTSGTDKPVFESIEDPYGGVGSSDEAASEEDEIYASETDEEEEDEDVPVARFGNLRHSLRKASPQARAGAAAKMALANSEGASSPEEAWFVSEVKRDDMVGLKDGEVGLGNNRFACLALPCCACLA